MISDRLVYLHIASDRDSSVPKPRMKSFSPQHWVKYSLRVLKYVYKPRDTLFGIIESKQRRKIDHWTRRSMNWGRAIEGEVHPIYIIEGFFFSNERMIDGKSFTFRCEKEKERKSHRSTIGRSIFDWSKDRSLTGKWLKARKVFSRNWMVVVM